MKKQLKFVILALALSLTTFTMVNAQSFKKSDKIVEGTVSLTKETDVKASWSLSPSIGYFVTDRVAVGVAGAFGETEDAKTSSVGVFGRCYFLNVGKNFKAYSQLDVATNSATVLGVKATSTTAGLGLGANYFLTSRLGLSAHVADLISYENQDSQSTLTVGFTGVNNPLTAAKFGVIYKF